MNVFATNIQCWRTSEVLSPAGTSNCARNIWKYSVEPLERTASAELCIEMLIKRKRGRTK